MIASSLNKNSVSFKQRTSILKDDKYPISLDQLIFLDVETIVPNLESSIHKWVELIQKKHQNWDDNLYIEENIDVFLKEKGGFYAETNQIICISVGVMYNNEFILKSFVGTSESDILLQLNFMLNSLTSKSNKQFYLVGHNIRNFDIPLIYKKMVKYNICPHNLLRLFGKKPWDIKLIDTYEEFKKMGEGISHSLNALAIYFDFDIKNDSFENLIEYYNKAEFDKIAFYCEQDVTICYNFILKLSSLDEFTYQK